MYMYAAARHGEPWASSSWWIHNFVYGFSAETVIVTKTKAKGGIFYQQPKNV